MHSPLCQRPIPISRPLALFADAQGPQELLLRAQLRQGMQLLHTMLWAAGLLKADASEGDARQPEATGASRACLNRALSRYGVAFHVFSRDSCPLVLPAHLFVLAQGLPALLAAAGARHLQPAPARQRSRIGRPRGAETHPGAVPALAAPALFPRCVRAGGQFLLSRPCHAPSATLPLTAATPLTKSRCQGKTSSVWRSCSTSS